MSTKFNGLRAQRNHDKKTSVLAKALHELRLDVSQAPILARRGTAKRAVAKLRILSEIGQTNGLQYKLSLSDSEFKKLVERYKKNKGLNEGQQKMLDFLLGKKVSKGLALRIASNTNYARMDIAQKISFFESIRLDPKQYGVERISVKDYEKYLFRPMNVILEGVKKRILWPIEDKYATSFLDEHFPSWRSVKSFFPKKGPRVRPALILRKIRELTKAGIEPRTDAIVRSVGTVKALKARDERFTKLSFRSRMFKGTGLEPKRRLRNTPVKKLEAKIERINQRISTIRAQLLTASSNSRIFLNEEVKELLDSRSNLVRDRDDLLFNRKIPGQMEKKSE